MENSLKDHYLNKKTAGYFNTARTEILSLINKSNERVLEIGCAEGATLDLLKTCSYAQWVGGVDISDKAIAKAKKRDIDYLKTLNIENESLEIDNKSIDLLLILDVLEHLVDPWVSLKKLTELLKADGTIIISIPNVRSLRVLLPLIFLGSWTYRDSGILDKTHLRFFTRKSAIELVESAGLSVNMIKELPDYHWLPNIINKATFKIFSQFLVPQYLIKASNRCHNPA